MAALRLESQGQDNFLIVAIKFDNYWKIISHPYQYDLAIYRMIHVKCIVLFLPPIPNNSSYNTMRDRILTHQSFVVAILDLHAETRSGDLDEILQIL